MIKGGDGMSSMTKSKIKAHRIMVACISGLIVLATATITIAKPALN